MNDPPHIDGLISCIIPVYNRQELIIECVESVLAQTYGNYEIIIVDDGSTDHTAEVLFELSQQYSKIKVFHPKNQGPGAARQRGLDHAKGEYIQFLDSDDLILPTKFELFIQAFESTEQPLSFTQRLTIMKLVNQMISSSGNKPTKNWILFFQLSLVLEYGEQLRPSIDIIY